MGGSSGRRRLLGAALALLLCAAPSPTPPPVPEYQLKAEFIERFTRFIDWPAEASPGPFVIGVYGDSPLRGFLETIARERKVKGRPVEVREVGRIEDIDACHILFVPGSKVRQLPQVLARASGRAILTVGDTRGFAEAGVLLNFFTEDERLRFEINEPAARASGLRIGAQVYGLARVVRTEGGR
jgi:hypothetical protein